MFKGPSVFGGGTGGNQETLRERFGETPFCSMGRFDGSKIEGTNQHRHTYFMNDEDGEYDGTTSATGMIKKRVHEFKSMMHAERTVARGGTSAKYGRQLVGKTAEEIVEFWKQVGDEASETGTRGHLWVEMFFNDCADFKSYEYTEDPVLKHALRYFMALWATEFDGKIVPVLTEQNLFVPGVFSGQADLFAQRVECRDDPELNKHFMCIDHKFSVKDLSPDAPAYNDNRMLGDCSSLVENKYSEYSIQQTLYSIVLMLYTDMTVTEFFIAQFHPIHGSYRWIPVKPLWEIARNMLLAERRTKLSKARDSLRSGLGVLERVYLARAGVTEFKDIYERNEKLDAAIAAGNSTAGVAKLIVGLSRDARELGNVLKHDTSDDINLEETEFCARIDRVIARARAAIAKQEVAMAKKVAAEVSIWDDVEPPTKRAKAD